ncbi:MAG: IS66 family transposase [Desulfobacterales bacterium CG23_combo_of_CG06-09_8_20_14_all_51_8]|nr:MAG: IS66 family transposase [Desulfobacterales bacterium CG23_combo_of_CG06-09_8_20_14_all_51_8]
MNLDFATLPEDTAALRDIIVFLADSHTDLEKKHQASEAKIASLQEYIRLLQNEIFGRRTEKHISPERDPQQLYLFDEPEVLEPEKADTITVPAHTRKKTGRKPLPKDLPRVDVIHDIDESEKVCACGCELSRIGEEVTEKLDIIPAKIQVIRHIRPKYACKNCEGVESDGPTVKIAPAPVQFISKGIATPGLVAQILVAKFEDACPFYRQEKIFARLGVDIPRSSMCGWAIKAAEQCQPIMELLHQKILSGPLINIDETPVQVMQEPGRKNTTKSYMWVFRGGPPDKPVLLYQYHPTRSGQVPGEFLKDYQGYIQTDAYSGYDALGRRPGIFHAGCWAHARRKFVEVVKAGSGGKKGNAEAALEYIRRLYAIEKTARKDGLSPDQIVELRQEKSKPILGEFRIWLTGLFSQTPPKGLLGKAVNYTLKNWPLLTRYLENGHVPMDNNAAENAIRPFVVGRKNWLFSGHPTGAWASSSLYSLIETAKACGLKPYDYLRYLFDSIPFAKTEAGFENLLPQNLTPAQIENFTSRCA